MRNLRGNLLFEGGLLIGRLKRAGRILVAFFHYGKSSLLQSGKLAGNIALTYHDLFLPETAAFCRAKKALLLCAFQSRCLLHRDDGKRFVV